MANRVLKTAGVVAGVAAGAAGFAYGAQRAVARNLRHRPDPDAGTLSHLAFEEARRLPGHDGGSLYTISRGHGPTIVLSHGVTIDSRVWVKQFDALPDLGLRVVAYDHRGHGQSAVGDTGHSLDNLAADVRTVLEGLDLRDVVLVGHSMGGLAAQAFAIHHAGIARTRVRGIVLLSTFARTPIASVAPLPVEKVSSWLDLASLMRRPQLGTLLARLGFGRDPLASRVELARQMLSECDPDTARDAIVPLLGVDLTAQLACIDLPTLVIGGTADVLTPPAESRRIARHLPGARLVLIERAGHMIMLERADALQELLLDFAREVGTLPDDLPLGASGRGDPEAQSA
jgi:pimeloyl-ACP methyl ester carboxylesterase